MTQQICGRAEAFLSSWWNAQEMRRQGASSTVQNELVKWIKPSAGRLKCNTYASFSNSLNIVSFGACIRDASGNFVIARTEWMKPILDVDLGEALGLLSAMLWARELNLVNMDFETDSKVVADSIYNNTDGVSDFIAIIKDCKYILMTDLANSDVKFIRRQANGVAHSLAKAAPSHANLHINHNIPFCIDSLINNEKL
jgi:hypothetical protein